MLYGERFSKFWEMLLENGGNFAYSTASGGDLYVKLPPSIVIRS